MKLIFIFFSLCLAFMQNSAKAFLVGTNPYVNPYANPYAKPYIYSCQSDFNFQLKSVKHCLSEQLVNSLTKYFNTPEIGWRVLGEAGDPYASIAEKVLITDSGFPYFYYRKLIRNHWRNSVGAEEMRNKFYLVAKLHYEQYVKIIKTGFWPDSDQILNSYLNAVRTYDLRDITVFDAAWDSAGMNRINSWQSLNKLPPERSVIPTRACFTIDSEEAREILKKDFSP